MKGNVSVGRKVREKVIRLVWEKCSTNGPRRAKWLSSEDRLFAITVHLFQPGLPSRWRGPGNGTGWLAFVWLLLSLTRVSSFLCLLSPSLSICISISPPPSCLSLLSRLESLYPQSSINTLDLSFCFFNSLSLAVHPLLSSLSSFCLAAFFLSC